VAAHRAPPGAEASVLYYSEEPESLAEIHSLPKPQEEKIRPAQLTNQEKSGRRSARGGGYDQGKNGDRVDSKVCATRGAG